MEKTTIYLDKDIKMRLLEMAADMSKRHGKRAAMSDIIRDALREYFSKREISIEGDHAAGVADAPIKAGYCRINRSKP